MRLLQVYHPYIKVGVLQVLTFGCNDEGALGRNTTDKEDAEFTAGTVDLPGKVKQISAGDSHTAALLEDGRVFAWGTFRVSLQLLFKFVILKFLEGEQTGRTSFNTLQNSI